MASNPYDLISDSVIVLLGWTKGMIYGFIYFM
jgi:hypothetical protein